MQIFEKALDEPKYSSMYAQLCKRLADNAHNFDPPESETTTFRRLLLSKCRDEFENRSQIAAQYDKQLAGPAPGVGANNGGGKGGGNLDPDDTVDAK